MGELFIRVLPYAEALCDRYQGASGSTASHVAPQTKNPVMQEQSQQSAGLQSKGDQDNMGYAANSDTMQQASQMMNAANPGFQYGG